MFSYTDDTWEEISPGKSRNTMKMEHLSRAELNTELECQVMMRIMIVVVMTMEHLNRAELNTELECNNGDVKMYWAELKTLGWNIFMVGILHNISTPYHDDIFPSSVFL